MRLIDADALRKPIYAEEDNITGSGMTYAEMDGYNDGIDAAWSRIDNAPTIDAESVRHGNWIEANDGTHYCSNCGHDAPFTWDDIDRNFMHSADEVPDFTANYCYCCGARMDEVSE